MLDIPPELSWTLPLLVVGACTVRVSVLAAGRPTLLDWPLLVPCGLEDGPPDLSRAVERRRSETCSRF